MNSVVDYLTLWIFPIKNIWLYSLEAILLFCGYGFLFSVGITFALIILNESILSQLREKDLTSKRGFFHWLKYHAYSTHPPTNDRIEALKLPSI
jgi:hypothetical protein